MSFYNDNAKEYIEQTIKCDMSQLYSFFEKKFSGVKSILDIGFGSGRDSLYFQNKGYDVISIDNCVEFIDYGKKIGLKKTILLDAENMNYNNEFDAIWASASLLHIKKEKLNNVFMRCSNALKDNAIMYCSFKYGDFNGIRDYRYYIDLNETSIHDYIKGTKLKIIDYVISKDVRDNNETKWISFILKKVVIDINYGYKSDVKDELQDPDKFSKKLKETHAYLWSKELPNGNKMELIVKNNRIISIGEYSFDFAPDSITNSYKNRPQINAFLDKSKNILEYRKLDYTIGSSIIFPVKDDEGKSNRTINQARGCIRQLSDRFDYALECIRLFYCDNSIYTPLRDCLKRYSNFFDLFIDFEGYVKFFFLDDLVDAEYKKVISFTGKFDFGNPIPSTIEEYEYYLKNNIEFIEKRNKRIKNSL